MAPSTLDVCSRHGACLPIPLGGKRRNTLSTGRASLKVRRDARLLNEIFDKTHTRGASTAYGLAEQATAKTPSQTRDPLSTSCYIHSASGSCRNINISVFKHFSSPPNTPARVRTHATHPAASGKVVESSAVTSASGMDHTRGRNMNPKSATNGPPAATTGSTPNGPPLTP